MREIYRKIAIVVVCFLTAISIISLSMFFKQRKDIKRIKENYEIEATGKTSYQQVITKSEMKKILSEELKTLKEFGVKERNIENIIEVRYEYVDSVRYRDTLVWVYDTAHLHRISDVCISGKCYYIDGKIFDDTLEIYDARFSDDILISLYREKRKCLFGKQKVKAIAVSGCSGDTLRILRNLSIDR